MVLPNFLLIGAPKSGTSSVYEYLKQHPEIYMPSNKEPHYFSLNDQPPNYQGPGDCHRFSNAIYDRHDYERLFSAVTTEKAIGEASTTYLGSKVAPHRIKEITPNSKLIAILRNPVEVGFSSYRHLIRDGDERLTSFELALEHEEQRIKDNWEGIWHYKRRGFYSRQLQNYYNLFDKNQIRVYLYDDFRDSSQRVIQDIINFLEVNPSFEIDISKKFNVSGLPRSMCINRLILKDNWLKIAVKCAVPDYIAEKISARIKSWNFSENRKAHNLHLKPETREYLIKVYRQDIINLQDMINRDLSNWLN
ncbi:sulfotransferase [Nodosilinea sp. P-1105]|uniref:sulfotransferase family protein n=1 Tax=Nodosilinea sp. P-1105 TaxID=2546229 RepID=UPI00146A3171|nr:sulfotransferase [Nodosilinea sp. P-1105]NMF82941.1 sulfotransferase [Nodosilinea sp. P-1105]